MSYKALNWAWDADLADSLAKFILVALADHASDHNGEDWVCFPSMSRLEAMTGVARKTVERKLGLLAQTGWISRRVKPGRRRKDGLYEYTLHRGREAGSSDPQSDGGGAGPSDPESGDGGATIGLSGSDHRTLGARPSDSQSLPPAPPIEINPQRTQSEPARGRADGDTDEAALGREFKRLSAAWAAVSKGRLAPRPSERAFRAAGAVWPAERVADAGVRYLAQDPDVKKFGPMRLHVWLDEGRFEPWMTAGDGAGGSAVALAGRPVWTGPSAIRAAVVAAKGEAFAASYLDPSLWDGERGVIVAGNGVRFERLAALALAGVSEVVR